MKRILLICGLLMSTSAAFCQEDFFALVGGPTFSNFSGDELPDTKFRIGYHVGALVSSGIVTQKVHLQGGGIFTTAGAMNKDDSDFRSELGYVSFPLQLKYYVTNQISVSAGSQVNLLISAKGKISESSIDSGDDGKAYEAGWKLGLNYEVSRLLLCAGYYQGMADVTGSGSFRNNLYQISVGYKLFNEK